MMWRWTAAQGRISREYAYSLRTAQMTLLPHRRTARLIAVGWLLAALAMLAVTVLHPETHENLRTALSSLLPLYFLSFPLGHAGLMAVNKLKLELYVGNGFVPDILSEGLMLWTLLTVLGYAQWFLLLPFLARKIRQLCEMYADWRASLR
jgi:hypothetical protein